MYKINARTLLIRTYYQEYEQDSSYHELVISKCDSFIRFIKREIEEITPEKQAMYLSFTSLLLKITKYRESSINNDIAKIELLSFLDNSTVIFAKDWLREKINNL